MMSTTIKSCTWPEKFSAEIDAQDDSVVICISAGDRHVGITVMAADLLAALRAEGVLPRDITARDKRRDEVAAEFWPFIGEYRHISEFGQRAIDRIIELEASNA